MGIRVQLIRSGKLQNCLSQWDHISERWQAAETDFYDNTATLFESVGSKS